MNTTIQTLYKNPSWNKKLTAVFDFTEAKINTKNILFLGSYNQGVGVENFKGNFKVNFKRKTRWPVNSMFINQMQQSYHCGFLETRRLSATTLSYRSKKVIPLQLPTAHLHTSTKLMLKNKEAQALSSMMVNSTKTYYISAIRNRFELHYRQIIVQDYLLKQNIKNLFETPKITKITCHWSSGAVLQEKKFIVNAMVALQLLTSQKPQLLFAKKSVAAFKVRKKQLIGCKVTLHGKGLYFFLENLVNTVLPRLSDTDINKMQSSAAHIRRPCRGQHHHSIGIKQLLMFPQLENRSDFFEILKGLDITISTVTTGSGARSLRRGGSIILSGFQLPL